MVRKGGLPPLLCFGLLSQAGVSNLTLDFVYAPTLPEYGTIAQIFQADLAQIGVTLKVTSMDIAAFFHTLVPSPGTPVYIRGSR